MKLNIHKDTIKKLKDGLLYIGFLAIGTNAIIELFEKGNTYYAEHYDESYVPTGIKEPEIDVYHVDVFDSIITEKVSDIIKRKGGHDSIPHTINYTKNNIIKNIDISEYIPQLSNSRIGILNTRGSSEISHTTGLIGYLQKDFKQNECILEEISEQRIEITPTDSYRDKVAKIQKFVWSFKYERDLVYLGGNKELPALSNYELPSLANIIIGKMDCNNKTGLFVQLCWTNNILVGIGTSKTHMTPVVYSNTNDPMRKLVSENTSIGDKYKGVVVDPTNTDITSGVRRPAIAGDMTGDSYNGMKFVVANPY